MKVSKSMESIWETKEKISREISGMSPEEVLDYFKSHRPEWAAALPRLERPRSMTSPSGLPNARYKNVSAK